MEMVLKPCPFCGKIPYQMVEVVRGCVADRVGYVVGCEKCGVKISDNVQSGEFNYRFDEMQNKVRNKWNTRN